MIAFSSASMANKIADEEVVTENNKKAEVEVSLIQIDPSVCLALRLFYYTYGISSGMTEQQASTASYKVYFGCMGDIGEELAADGL